VEPRRCLRGPAGAERADQRRDDHDEPAASPHDGGCTRRCELDSGRDGDGVRLGRSRGRSRVVRTDLPALSELPRQLPSATSERAGNYPAVTFRWDQTFPPGG
jgi:hypothetical protein